MNRKQRRARGDTRSKSVHVSAPVEILGHATVTVNGVSWPMIASRAWTMASPALTIPAAMRPLGSTAVKTLGGIMAGDGVALHADDDDRVEPLSSVLHEILESVGVLPTSGIADSVLHGYIKGYVIGPNDSAFGIAGEAFAWDKIAFALAMFPTGTRMSVRAVRVWTGQNAVRFDGASMRVMVLPLVDWHGPRLDFLNREQMDAMESAQGEA